MSNGIQPVELVFAHGGCSRLFLGSFFEHFWFLMVVAAHRFLTQNRNPKPPKQQLVVVAVALGLLLALLLLLSLSVPTSFTRVPFFFQ